MLGFWIQPCGLSVILDGTFGVVVGVADIGVAADIEVVDLSSDPSGDCCVEPLLVEFSILDRRLMAPLENDILSRSAKYPLDSCAIVLTGFAFVISDSIGGEVPEIVSLCFDGSGSMCEGSGEEVLTVSDVMPLNRCLNGPLSM